MLNKFFRTLFLFVVLLFISFFVSTQSVSAACSCTVTDNQGTCGSNCNPLTGVCTATCVNGPYTRSVSGTLTGNTCEYFSFSSSCSINAGVCNLQAGSTPGRCTIATTPPVGTPAPTSPPSNGSCGSCNSCGGASASECAMINGVCSKAGYCSGGGTSGPYCGNYSPNCGFSTGGACNTTGSNGPPYVCIFCPATKPNDNWVPMGSFQYPNCTNSACGNAGTPSTPVWRWSIPAGIANGAVITPGQYYPFFGAPGGTVATVYQLSIDDHSVGNPGTYDWTVGVTGGEIMYQTPRGWPYTYKANTDYTMRINTMQSLSSTCISSPLVLNFTTKVAAPPAPAPTLTLTASPTTVPLNGSSTLTWSSTNATTCTASGDWSGSKTVNGSQVEAGISSNDVYTLSCTGTGGTIVKSVNVNVTVPPAPTLTLTASPTSVPTNGSSTITWSSTNTTSCTASNAWTGAKAVSGSQSQTGITTGKSYVLTCTGPGGSISKTVNVSVIGLPPLPSVNLVASPATVPSNGSTTLTWTTTNATTCTASNGWTGAKTVNGSQVITGITNAKTFVLTCTGTGGTSNDSAIVSVSPGTLPSVNLTAAPTSVPSAGSTTLTWTTTNATTCTASNGWTGVKSTNGSQIITNLLSNKTFVLTCTGPGGTGNDSAAVSVAAPVLPSVNLTATPSSIVGPSNVRLTWTAPNATSCTASGGWTGARGTSGAQTMVAVSASTTYRLTCSNAAGSATDTAAVTYTAPQCGIAAVRDPAPPVCAPNPPSQNGSITWTWPAVRGADMYDFSVIDATTGSVVAGTSTGLVNGQSNFNCRPNQATPDLCSKTTVLPPGLYRSMISSGSSTGSCQTTPGIIYPPVGQPGKEVLLCPAVPWWQSGTGSVFSQGNIKSTIPLTCSAPACVNQIIKNGNSSAPGIAISGSSGTIDSGTGVVSSTNWAAKSALTGRTPDYDSFVSLIPTSITPSDPGATCGGGTFNSSGATTGDGYYWYRHNGSVNITSDLTLDPGRKVILFVDGNLTISGKITYNPANSFFMPIVKGNITVSPTVTTATGTPTLTGIFYCGGQFSSGAGTGPLNILGSVVAVGGVSLERDLGDANHTESSENFSISPDLILNYPGALSFKRPVWKEIAP